ncbi:MAG: histidine kinase [Chthoniobacterales bacterium]
MIFGESVAQPVDALAICHSVSLSVKRFSKFWRYNLVGWTIFILPQFLNSLAAHGEVKRALGFALVLWPLQILLTGLLHPIYRRMAEGSERFSVMSSACMIVLSLVASFIQTVIVQQFVGMTGWSNPAWTGVEEWLLRFIFYWLIFMAWGLVYFWLKAEGAAIDQGLRADKALGEARRMELYFLRSQLDPHFVFNTLNGIAAQIPVQPEQALEMVRELAGYLRYSLDHRHDAVMPLSEEMDGLSGYLKIAKTRFGDQLETRIESTLEARDRFVPSFLLQPLVENAVKHSLEKADPPWKLAVEAMITPTGVLHVVIRNTGKLIIHQDRIEGVGLEILRRRLALHYPDRHRFLLTEVDGEVRAEIEMEGEPCSG